MATEYLKTLADNPPAWAWHFVAECVKHVLPELRKRHHGSPSLFAQMEEEIAILENGTAAVAASLSDKFGQIVGTIQSGGAVAFSPSGNIAGKIVLLATRAVEVPKKEQEWQAELFLQYQDRHTEETVFVVLLFQRNHSEIIQKLYDLDPEDELTPFQTIPQTLFFIRSRKTVHALAEELGLVEVSTLSRVPGAYGVIGQVDMPINLAEWLTIVGRTKNGQ